jgi:hypothetical protein
MAYFFPTQPTSGTGSTGFGYGSVGRTSAIVTGMLAESDAELSKMLAPV